MHDVGQATRRLFIRLPCLVTLLLLLCAFSGCIIIIISTYMVVYSRYTLRTIGLRPLRAYNTTVQLCPGLFGRPFVQSQYGPRDRPLVLLRIVKQ